MHVYLINLDRQPERLAAMTGRLGSLGLKFERIQAVDAQTENIRPHIAAIKSRINANFRSPAAAHAAVYLSHRKIWQHMVDTNAPAALILEDDAVPQDWDERILDIDINSLSLDLLRLEAIEIPPGDKHFKELGRWLGTEDSKTSTTVLGRKLSRKATWGSAAYILTLQGARKCLDAGEYWFHVDHFRIWTLYTGLRTAYLDPPMWVQSGESSSTQMRSEPLTLVGRLSQPLLSVARLVLIAVAVLLGRRKRDAG